MKTPHLLVLTALLALFVPSAIAQKLLDKSKAPNDWANDPYSQGGDPAILAAAGYVSTGGFEFGPAPDTQEDTAKYLGYLDLRWVETEHFEIGLALPQVKVTQSERDKIRAELTELQAFMPEIDPRTRILDPWLRLHLTAKRLEAHYDEMLAFLGVTDDVFKDLKPMWNTQGKYMGIGPYLGNRGKFEILIVPSLGAYTDYMRAKLGLTTKRAQRWNYTDRDTLAALIHTEEGKLRIDEALHGHLVFHVTQIALNAYKHYSYDLPIWAREGSAHYFERRINPRFNTFDGGEGSAGEKINKIDWKGPTKRAVKSGDMPSFATLIGRKAFAELEAEDHLGTWSIIDFLLTVHPEFLPVYFDRISGLQNEKFVDDGSTLPEVQREVFKEALGMSYASFDAAWKAWVDETY